MLRIFGTIKNDLCCKMSYYPFVLVTMVIVPGVYLISLYHFVLHLVLVMSNQISV